MSKKKHKKRMKQADQMAAMGGFPAGLQAMLGGGRRNGLAAMRPRDQFLVGALIGAAAVYVLGDENLRGKLIKAGVQMYSGLTGGIEEMKEQMADIRAEMAAGESAGA